MSIKLIDTKEELFRISKIPSSNGLQGYTKYNYQTFGKGKINENLLFLFYQIYTRLIFVLS